MIEIYCQWIDGDLFLYADAKGRLTCCGCRLYGRESYTCGSREDMLDHVHHHEEAGHEVQSAAIERLETEVRSDRQSRPTWRPFRAARCA